MNAIWITHKFRSNEQYNRSVKMKIYVHTSCNKYKYLPAIANKCKVIRCKLCQIKPEIHTQRQFSAKTKHSERMSEHYQSRRYNK